MSNDVNVFIVFICIYGNCGMCKCMIEGVLNDVEGIYFVEWDVKLGMLFVVYEVDKVLEDDIKVKVVVVGYDLDMYCVLDEVYVNLYVCC